MSGHFIKGKVVEAALEAVIIFALWGVLALWFLYVAMRLIIIAVLKTWAEYRACLREPSKPEKDQ